MPLPRLLEHTLKDRGQSTLTTLSLAQIFHDHLTCFNLKSQVKSNLSVKKNSNPQLRAREKGLYIWSMLGSK